MATFTIEKPGFSHNLASKLNQHYQILSKWHFADFEIPRLYSHIKDNIVFASLKRILALYGDYTGENIVCAITDTLDN